MIQKIKKYGPFFIVTAALLWSLDGILRISLYSLPPTVVVFYEHLLGAIILLCLFPRWIGDLKKMTKKEWTAITLVALFSGALGTIFYTAALGQVQYIQYSVVVLLQQQLQPIWAVLAATLLLKEKLTKRFLIWGAVALVAVYFVTFKDMTVNIGSTGTLIGGAFALLAGIMWGTSTAISKFTLNKVSFLTATSLRFLITPIFAMLLIVGMGQTDQLFALTAQQWQTLLFITLSTGMVALLFYYYGLKQIQAKASPFYELVWPASAVLIDFFLFHKSFSITQILGIIVLVFSIIQITKATTTEKKNNKR